MLAITVMHSLLVFAGLISFHVNKKYKYIEVKQEQ